MVGRAVVVGGTVMVAGGKVVVVVAGAVVVLKVVVVLRVVSAATVGGGSRSLAQAEPRASATKASTRPAREVIPMEGPPVRSRGFYYADRAADSGLVLGEHI